LKELQARFFFICYNNLYYQRHLLRLQCAWKCG